jgi:hypothetical protein
MSIHVYHDKNLQQLAAWIVLQKIYKRISEHKPAIHFTKLKFASNAVFMNVFMDKRVHAVFYSVNENRDFSPIIQVSWLNNVLTPSRFKLKKL